MDRQNYNGIRCDYPNGSLCEKCDLDYTIRAKDENNSV